MRFVYALPLESMLDDSASTTSTDDRRASRAAEVLVKLDKAIRTRRFYDASHDLVRRFEADLLSALRAYGAEHGDLSLRIRPNAFEIGEAAAEASGLDEFALAFFRQGVIALRVRHTIAEDEFGRFVALCAAGLQATSADADDLPALLWKARLEGVQYAAPVGYTEDDGGLRDDDELFVDQETVSQVIGESLTLDLERLPAEARAAYEARLGKLKGDDDELPVEVLLARQDALGETLPSLARHTFSLFAEFACGPDRPRDLGATELATIALRFRALFLAEGDLDGLGAVADLAEHLVASNATSAEDRAALEGALADRLSEADFEALASKLPGGAAAHVDRMTRLIRVFGGNERSTLAKLADRDSSEEGRRALEAALVEVAGHDPEYLLGRFRSLEGARAVEALEWLAAADVAQARMAVAVRLPAASEETQGALLAAIPAMAGLLDERLRNALVRLAAKGGPLQARILETFASRPFPELAEAALGWVNATELTNTPAVLGAALRLLVASGREGEALPAVTALLERRSLFGRRQLLESKHAVVVALASSGATDVRALLDAYASGKDRDLAKLCADALAGSPGAGPTSTTSEAERNGGRAR